VEAGEDFYAVGEQISRLASITGVDIGFVDPSGLNEGFRVAITALEVGEYTKVLEGPNGWFLFQRVE
jgi:parvulin-like peptidyl-prolyl isomerase